MFDIGWSELLVIGIVALIAIGPKELPGVLRTVGQYMGKIRRMASEFQGQFQEAMREAEMADLKKQVDDITESATGLTNYDPLEGVKNDFETAFDDKPKDTTAPTDEPSAGAAQDATVPQPATGGADLAIAPQAPQPNDETKDEIKSGGGA